MNFKLYTSNFKGNAQNCYYPNCIEIANGDDMKKAVAYDHVCSSFKDSKRGIANFKSSNVIVMDCDNDHSNEPDKWLTPELIEEGFVREVISKIQTMRKDAGFEVMDHICVSMQDNDKIADIVKKNEEQIKSEVLANETKYDGAVGFTKEWNINGEKVMLGVEKM